MTPERRALLIAQAEVHDRWVQSKLAAVPFDSAGRPGSEDYNQHYVDLDGDDDEFHAAMAAIA